MRILKLIFFSIFFLAIFGSGGFFIAREVFLSMGISSMRTALKQVSTVSRNSGIYATECRKKGIIELDESSIKTIQLRFTSDTEYQIEVICRQFSLDPIIVEEGTLPYLVRKSDGFSGVVWGEDLSGVAIQALGKVKSVYVEDFSVYTGNLDDVEGSIGPLTSCEGNGFSCCSADTAMGSGEILTSVSDCPQSCYESCIRRPVILSVSTQPFFDLKTRVLTVNRGEKVVVAYVTDFADSKELNIEINFGDGESISMSEYSGDVLHQYNCSQETCTYNLEVSAINEKGIEAARTAVTRVTVIVQ
ncbi:MAG: hypothetical protein GW941_01675 [Candidatus Pacebacteria bacterium]|nr:hypothetical protein [Candidatus Paceibacterota bacterium]